MKILMMTNTYIPIVGGLEKSIQVFSEEFRARGHEVKIVAPEFDKRPEHEPDVIRVPSIEKFVGTDFSVGLPLPEVLQDALEEFKPDIVHSHHPFLMGDLALRVCGQNGIPLVFTYHTMFEHYTDNFAMDNEVMQKFVVELATGYANMADQVIAPSESVANLLLSRSVRVPIEVVPTGIDVRRFSEKSADPRKKFGIPSQAFVAGHTGRLAPEKNLIFLTQAVAEFLSREKKAHFLVVGQGPCEREMRKIFRALGVQKRVHFAGVQKGKALVEAYQAMDVFAFASKSETQGIVVAEAMAAHLPVVAVDAFGVREVVKDKINGRLLNAESRTRFASALSWCLSRKSAEWEEIRRNAFKTAESFSSAVCAEKALRVYEALLDRRGKPSQNQWGHNQWEAFVGRFGTELQMLLNLGRAAGKAIVKATIKESSPLDKLSESYQKKARGALEAWVDFLKKTRVQIQKAGPGQREKLERKAERLARRIRELEVELAELGSRVLAATQALDEQIASMHLEIQKETGEKNPEKTGRVKAAAGAGKSFDL